MFGSSKANPWEDKQKAFAKRMLQDMEKKEKETGGPASSFKPKNSMFSFTGSSKGKEGAKMPLHMRITDLKTPGKKAPGT